MNSYFSTKLGIFDNNAAILRQFYSLSAWRLCANHTSILPAPR